MQSLEENQRACLAAITKLLKQNNWTPSIQEIADEMDVAIGTAYNLIRKLTKSEYIRRTKGRARSIQIVKRSRKKSAA